MLSFNYLIQVAVLIIALNLQRSYSDLGNVDERRLLVAVCSCSWFPICRIRWCSDFRMVGDQVRHPNSDGIGQLIERDDRRVSPTAFKAADVPLAEARALLDLLLSQAALFP